MPKTGLLESHKSVQRSRLSSSQAVKENLSSEWWLTEQNWAESAYAPASFAVSHHLLSPHTLKICLDIVFLLKLKLIFIGSYSCGYRHWSLHPYSRKTYRITEDIYLRPDTIICTSVNDGNSCQGSSSVSTQCLVTPGPLTDNMANRRFYLQVFFALVLVFQCSECGRFTKTEGNIDYERE